MNDRISITGQPIKAGIPNNGGVSVFVGEELPWPLDGRAAIYATDPDDLERLAAACARAAEELRTRSEGRSVLADGRLGT